MNHCLGILSNLCADSAAARKEVLKYKALDLVVQAFQTQIIKNSTESLGSLTLVLRNLSQKFNAAYFANLSVSVLAEALIQILYIGNEKIE